VLWAKLCELHWVKTHLEQPALLLLDDIYSELDDINQDLVSRLLEGQQTIMTAIHQEDIERLRDVIGHTAGVIQV
jgi:recombinational DNA repair ATPase RecF